MSELYNLLTELCNSNRLYAAYLYSSIDYRLLTLVGENVPQFTIPHDLCAEDNCLCIQSYSGMII